jgi:isoquinoline 1-oxidoreductase beta subunit
VRISRRAFLTSSAALGGGLAIGLYVGKPMHLQNTKPQPFDAWIHFLPDGKAEIVLNKSEMGQGVFTSLPMLIAEEAEIDWEQVTVKQGERSSLTGGSGSIRHNYLPFRQTGAVVRMAMIAAAAHQWNVPIDECFARNSQVVHRHSGRFIAYRELLDHVRNRPLPEINAVRLKNPKDFVLIGKPLPHKDIPAKVNGSACFGLDVRLPGMVFAVVAQCPRLDGILGPYNTTKAKAVPGVLDVFEIPYERTGGEIAVVANTTWAAIQGRNALSIEWKPGEHYDESTKELRVKMRAALNAREYWNWSNTQVNPDDVPSARRIASIYEFPFLAHTSIEPMNTTVQFHDGGCEVWSPTQDGMGTKRSIAKALGLSESDVTVHVPFVGGGFGARFSGRRYEVQAALIAKKMQRPVQVMWTREDDILHDEFRTACMHRLRGGLDEKGNIVAWSHRIADPSLSRDLLASFETLGAVDSPYPVQNFRISYAPVESGVPRGWWRGVAQTFNGFAVECFIDELAYAAGEDPYLFRRRLLLATPLLSGTDATSVRDGADDPQPDPKALVALLDLVAEKTDWKKPLGQNRGRGYALGHSHKTYLAQVAEVTVNGGVIRVDRIVTALDCGQPINPNGVKAQIEGGTLLGLSAALREEITVADGKIQQENFNSYNVLRMPDVPALETYVVSSNRDPGGIGEAASPLPAPSIANAVFAATGKRLRKLPLRLVL